MPRAQLPADDRVLTAEQCARRIRNDHGRKCSVKRWHRLARESGVLKRGRTVIGGEVGWLRTAFVRWLYAQRTVRVCKRGAAGRSVLEKSRATDHAAVPEVKGVA